MNLSLRVASDDRRWLNQWISDPGATGAGWETVFAVLSGRFWATGFGVGFDWFGSVGGFVCCYRFRWLACGLHCRFGTRFLLDSTVVLLLVVVGFTAVAVTACAFNVGMTNRVPYIKALVRADGRYGENWVNYAWQHGSWHVISLK